MPDATDRINFLAEALDPGDNPWVTHETPPINSAVDLANHVAYIPRARTRASEQIRLHEAAHISHTEQHEHEHQRRTDICKMLEEVRVDHLLLQQRGLDVRNRMDDFDLETRLTQTKNDKLLNRLLEYLQFSYVATSPSVSPEVINYAQQMFLTLPANLQAMCRNALGGLIRLPTVDERERHAQIIDAFFEPPAPPPAQPMRLKPSVMEEINRQITEEITDQRKKEAAEQAAKNRTKKVAEKYTVPELDPTEEAKLGNPGGDGSKPRLGGAEIHDHIARNPMVSHVKAPFTRTGRGLVPEFMENYCIDKRIYRTEHRGGVIVLDCSGSMSPNFSLITEQMKEFPNLVVLSYQSTYSYGNEPFPVNGRICVHARSGKIDPHFRREPGTAGGNSVDLEALMYGARFKGPRVWVSDGLAHGGNYDTGMTGLSTRYESGLHTKIREVMQQEHYIRVETLKDALAWVTRSGPVEYTTAAALDYCEPEIISKHTRKGRRP